MFDQETVGRAAAQSVEAYVHQAMLSLRSKRVDAAYRQAAALESPPRWSLRRLPELARFRSLAEAKAAYNRQGMTAPANYANDSHCQRNGGSSCHHPVFLTAQWLQQFS
jgi:hypothetical protein